MSEHKIDIGIGTVTIGGLPDAAVPDDTPIQAGYEVALDAAKKRIASLEAALKKIINSNDIHFYSAEYEEGFLKARRRDTAIAKRALEGKP